MMILQGNGQTHTTATFFVITTCPEWCKNLGSRIEFFVVTTIPAPCFRTHILDLILELCKVIVFPLYLYLCVCVSVIRTSLVANKGGLTLRQTRRPFTLPPSQQVPCPPIPIIPLLFVFLRFLHFLCISPQEPCLLNLPNISPLHQILPYYSQCIFIPNQLHYYYITTRLESLHTPCLQNY